MLLVGLYSLEVTIFVINHELREVNIVNTNTTVLVYSLDIHNLDRDSLVGGCDGDIDSSVPHRVQSLRLIVSSTLGETIDKDLGIWVDEADSLQVL